MDSNRMRVIFVILVVLTIAIILLYNNTGKALYKSRKVTGRSQNVLGADCYCKSKRHTTSPSLLYSLSSSCSDEASQDFAGQKVLAFSLYLPLNNEEERRTLYLKGIRGNLQKMRIYYPDYTMRVYTNVQLQGEFCTLVCTNADIRWCDIQGVPSHGDLSDMFFMTWRFLPLGDPTVNVFLSRDLDSLISEREVAVVNDWLQQNKSFHVMRDRKLAHDSAILGGLWGARNDLLGKEAKTIQTQLIINSVNPTMQEKGSDQDIVKEIIYNQYRDEFVAYDSYHCEHYRKETEVRPFPIRRLSGNDFTGNPHHGGGDWDFQTCPVECRPSYGKDWTYC